MEIPSGSKVFIDTNILLYSITEHPKYKNVCDKLLDKVKGRDIEGVISVIVLNELIHKLVIGEIAEKEEIELSRVAPLVKRNPGVLKGLRAYEILEDVENNYNLAIIRITKEDFSKARQLMDKHHLFSNDAMHLAVMLKERIVHIATNDSDFDKVEEIKVWKPSSEEPI